jgi:hypothetical protein
MSDESQSPEPAAGRLRERFFGQHVTVHPTYAYRDPEDAGSGGCCASGCMTTVTRQVPKRSGISPRSTLRRSGRPLAKDEVSRLEQRRNCFIADDKGVKRCSRWAAARRARLQVRTHDAQWRHRGNIRTLINTEGAIGRWHRRARDRWARASVSHIQLRTGWALHRPGHRRHAENYACSRWKSTVLRNVFESVARGRRNARATINSPPKRKRPMKTGASTTFRAAMALYGLLSEFSSTRSAFRRELFT